MFKTLRVSFFKVRVRAKAEIDFEEIIRKCKDLPDDETRALERPDGPVRLQFIRKSLSVWQGELIRIRIGEEPKKANRKGKVELIHFEEDEGLGEETAFVYDPELGILAYHEHRGGVTLSNAAKYFKAVGQVRAVELAPVMKPEVLERVAKMGTVREFIVHLAGVEDGRRLRGMGAAAASLFGAASAFRAPRAHFTMKIGKNGTLAQVREAVMDLLNAGPEVRDQVSKLVVIGSEEEGEESAIINLLADRLVVEVPVGLKNGILTDAVRRSAVFEAWEDNRASLRAIYGAKT